MGKGYNNFMSKKPFHPASKDNIKRVWMAEQRSIDYKKKEEEMRLQYEKEQDLYNNRLLVAGSDSKDKLSLNFMYEAPPGVKKTDSKELDTAEPEYKFEWQRNAPRESFAKIIWIFVINQCPLFNTSSLIQSDASTAAAAAETITKERVERAKEDGRDLEMDDENQQSTKAPKTKEEQAELIRSMKEEQGLALKRSLYGSYGAKRRDGDNTNQEMITVKDPEVAFLDSLSAKEKRKLLKKLQKITNKQMGIKESSNSDKKKRKKDKKSKKSSHKKSSKNEHRYHSSDSDDSDNSKPDVRPEDSPPSRKHRMDDDNGYRRHDRSPNRQSSNHFRNVRSIVPRQRYRSRSRSPVYERDRHRERSYQSNHRSSTSHSSTNYRDKRNRD
ncbi:hypothetical protein RDWZM_004898 [Blomia tropicalis]|uniref:CBF1-interacting co-repressor CIR N-terminal domain-containing protein n=1 Tax=Blomia tropicalis TaxID=40697 RepID=A0A9Q0RN05_BLOTA|nr:hypothetical protein RDWZM_004898 [Blomia tropicalis]